MADTGVSLHDAVGQALAGASAKGRWNKNVPPKKLSEGKGGTDEPLKPAPKFVTQYDYLIPPYSERSQLRIVGSLITTCALRWTSCQYAVRCFCR